MSSVSNRFDFSALPFTLLFHSPPSCSYYFFFCVCLITCNVVPVDKVHMPKNEVKSNKKQVKQGAIARTQKKAVRGRRSNDTQPPTKTDVHSYKFESVGEWRRQYLKGQVKPIHLAQSSTAQRPDRFYPHILHSAHPFTNPTDNRWHIWNCCVSSTCVPSSTV